MSSNLETYAIQLLAERGVSLEEIARLVYELQSDFVSQLDLETCLSHVRHILTKREVQNAIVTGITLDKLAEQKKLEEPLQSIIERDEGLYGIDEVLALAIINIYGSIGFTNFGYIDKLKPGILGWLNHQANGCHTFLDDIVGAIAAAASSRLAHDLLDQRD